MSKPWITKDILFKCKIRDSMLKNISKEYDPILRNTLRNEYKKLRNDITCDKRVSKKIYYTAFFENNKSKSSEMWNGRI